MATRRDAGDFYVIEIEWQKVSLKKRQPYHSFKWVYSQLYSSKRDADTSLTEVERLCVYEIAHGKNTPENNIIISKLNIKRCTVYVYDTSRL